MSKSQRRMNAYMRDVRYSDQISRNLPSVKPPTIPSAAPPSTPTGFLDSKGVWRPKTQPKSAREAFHELFPSLDKEAKVPNVPKD